MDTSAWLDAHAEYEEMVGELSLEYSRDAAALPNDLDLDRPTWSEATSSIGAEGVQGQVRNSGTAVLCGGALGVPGSEEADYVYYSSYNVTAVDDPMNVRERKVVYIEGGDTSCSGTLVSNDTVLTAAHCLYDFDHGEVVATSFTVCDYGNATANVSPDLGSSIACSTATATIPFGFVVFGDFGSDYGVLHLDSPMSHGFMAMWDVAANGTTAILSHNTYSAGYPGAAGPACAWPTTVANLRTDSPTTINGSNGYKSANTTLAYESGLLKTELVSSPGASGSPLYFFPYNGLTTHYISGVLDGWNTADPGACPYCLPEWTGGANVGVFRSWVIANM